MHAYFIVTLVMLCIASALTCFGAFVGDSNPSASLLAILFTTVPCVMGIIALAMIL